MTCIVAVKDKNGDVYVAGDCAAISSDETIVRRRDEKVFKNGDFLIGFSGSFRFGQLLRHSLVPPKKNKSTDDMKFMVNEFIDSIRQMQFEKGCSLKDGESEIFDGQLIVVYKREIYIIDNDYQVGLSKENYAAIGSGSSIALGSLYTSEITSQDLIERRITWALDAASEFCAGVRAPYSYIKAQ